MECQLPCSQKLSEFRYDPISSFDPISSRGLDYYVITCTECLRSLSIPAEKNVQVLRELRTLDCISATRRFSSSSKKRRKATGLPMIAPHVTES